MFFQILISSHILKNFLFCCSMASQNNGDDHFEWVTDRSFRTHLTNLVIKVCCLLCHENWKWSCRSQCPVMATEKSQCVCWQFISIHEKINKKTRKKILLPHQILMLASLLKPNSFLHTWPPWNLQKKTDNYGPEIDQRICNVLQSECWQSPYQKEEITQYIGGSNQTKNALAFKPLEVNIHMTKSEWQTEKDLQYIDNAVCRAW